MAEARKTVFVSYAHEDRKWADELVTHMAPWIRDKRVNIWDDSRIKAGAKWLDEIESALDQAAVAVLLVSKDFLASEFIAKYELPRLLERAGRNELRLAWVAVGYSAVRMTPLSQFQAANDPERPLERLSAAQRNKVMVEVATKVADAVTMRSLAGGLRIIDETTEPIEAALAGRPENRARRFGVRATYEASVDRISFSGATQVITVADLERLPAADREFIADLEDSLDRNYKRWAAVRKGLGDAGGALDDEVEGQLTRIAKIMCRDLQAILGFLRDMHKGELEDHYSRYRYICEELHAA